MKRVCLGILAIAASVSAQQAPPKSLFQTVRPQVLLTIRPDPNGSRADLVEARTIDPTYPADQLKAQILQLGKFLNSEPRGLAVGRSSITGESASLTTIKAICAIDEIISRSGKGFHLQEIARAFAGYPEPATVSGLTVQFIGQSPTKSTLLSFGGEGDPIQIEGVFDAAFQTLEYRMKLNTQNPEEITVPEGGEQTPTKEPSNVAGSGINWLVWILVFVSAIAVGALVYSLLVTAGTSRRTSG